MSGDTEMEDTEVSDGASENEYSDHEHDVDLVEKEEDDNTDMAEHNIRASEVDNNGRIVGIPVTKPKLDPKDPLRPRRKKARRACFACQRAHLTCGDERPCQRCIKRGLADACQDGVRKKAKYLHDAPAEALLPVLGPHYDQENNNAGRPNNNRQNVVRTTSADTSSSITGNFFPQPDQAPSFPLFANHQVQMPPPLQSRMSYGSQQGPMSPTYQSQINRQPALQNMTMPQVTDDLRNLLEIDPSDPILYNYDIDGFTFSNQWGALELKVLDHLSSGAVGVDGSQKDTMGSISSQGMGDVGFNNGVFPNNMNQFGNIYSSADMIPDYSGANQIFNAAYQGLPHAYAIGTNNSHHSPNTDSNESPSASTMAFESSPTTMPYNTPIPQPQQRPAKRQDIKAAVKTKNGQVNGLGKRTRDASGIYDTVTEPYPYTAGFHSLIAFLQRRFSGDKTLRIAKSLAAIRPSFIACTKELNRPDLIFMEKCFQRTLFEYEDYMLSCCTPTIVCRRTGEVAAVNKEFTLLTGWRKDVLLGKEPNLNTNNGKSASGPASGAASLVNTGRGGITTPRLRPASLAEQNEGRPQPVFFAELLDDESVISFYEDFAKLAFGDSRGSVTRRCKLLKYQPKEELGDIPESGESGDAKNISSRKRKDPPSGGVMGGIGGMGNRVREIDGEHGIGRLERDGKMDCSYCWTVKRDVFEVPMLLVMNFLPCI